MAKKCQFRKKNGERCDADPQTGKILCVFHDPARADDGHRARQAGGRTRSRPARVLSSDTPDHALDSPKDVSNLLAASINQLRRGELDPKVANAVGYLGSILLRAMEQGSTESRLAHLEAILGQSRIGSDFFEFRSSKGERA